MGVHPVQQDGAPGGLIHLGEQVENGGLARAVGADEAGNLGAANGHVEVLDGGQAAEVDAQMLALQDGALVNVPLRDLVGAGDGDQLDGLLGNSAHCLAPSFFSWRSSRTRAMKFHNVGLLVASMTRISTMAYTSIR